MRPISADLASVQRANAPRARATATIEGRGQTPTVPPVAWAELVRNTGQAIFSPTTAIGLADGRILKFTANLTSKIEQHIIADPPSPASWATPTTTTIRGHGALALAAIRFAPTSIRLFYIHAADGNIYFIQSTTNGATWSGPTLVYAGADAAGDLVAAYNTQPLVQNGPWCFGFSTYNSGTGNYTARFGYYDGAAWVTHAYGESGWRAAGIWPYANTPSHTVLLCRQQDRGPSRLRRLTKHAAVYSNPADIDQTQAGRFGLGLAYYRFCQLPEYNASLAVAGEYASGGGAYQGICALAQHSELLVDEPIIFPAVACLDEQPYTCICADAAGNLYLIGDTVVYSGARLIPTAGVLEPTRYTYDDHLLEIDFAPDTASSTLRPGDHLLLTRALSWDGKEGSATLRFLILSVERGTERLRVLAADPVGYLGTARCRRPSILNDGALNSQLAAVLYRLAARVGLTLIADHPSIAGAAALPLTLMPGESLRGAAYRATSQARVTLVPANDASWSLTAIAPPNSSSGHYSDTPHLYGVTPNEHPIHSAREVSDLRRLAFAYILGAYSTDPEDGAVVAMAAGPVLPGTRPIAYSLTNQRYNSMPRVQAAAASEAARQSALPIDAVITANANLALEVHDLVDVTEPRLGWSARRFRVRRIQETFDRGLLTQTLYLGSNLS